MITERKQERERRMALLLAVLTFLMATLPCFSTDSLKAYASFRLNFTTSGVAGHPDISAKIPGEDWTSHLFCMVKGASAKSGYEYEKVEQEVNYTEGSLEEKRLFWAYVLTYGNAGGGNYKDDPSLMDIFHTDLRNNTYIGKQVAWSGGKSNGGSDLIENYARDGFMSLENIPAGCKSPQDIYSVVSRYGDPKTPMDLSAILSGPGTVSAEKLYNLAGIKDWATFRKYCTITAEDMKPVTKPSGETYTPRVVIQMDDQGFTYKVINDKGAEILDPGPVTLRVEYDQSIFRILNVEGILEYYRCAVSGSQPLYRASGKVEVIYPSFYLSDGGGVADEPGSPGTGTSDWNGSRESNIYSHEETFESHYTVNLEKYDYETGMPLADSTWQVLSKFTDKRKLSDTEEDGGIVKENMRGKPVTWNEWLILKDERKTDADGKISHTDTRYYDFSHTFCDGHAEPPEPSESPGGNDPEALADYESELAEYEALVEEYEAEVEACEELAQESDGTHHHWMGGSEDAAGEEEAFEASGCRAARDEAYEAFINLRYAYTFRETDARDGYIIHGEGGHPDDVPIEIIETPASESRKNAVWKAGSNEGIVVSGYARDERGAEDDIEEESLLLPFEGEKTERAERASRTAGSSEALKQSKVAEPSEVLKQSQAAEATEDLKQSQVAEATQAFKQSQTEDWSEVWIWDEDIDGYAESYVGGWKEKATLADADHADASLSDASVFDAGLSTPSDATLSDARKKEIYYYDRTTPYTVSLTQGDGLTPYVSERKESIRKNVIRTHMDEVDTGPSGRVAHTFVVYDHRTEGQIHFNKRDLALAGTEKENEEKEGMEESGAYDSYGDTQGDAVLSGAVYGLFAADPIYGPDTQFDADGTVVTGTGLLFDANDLVAVATTDQNGDGSFMVITERPHSIYDYETGQIIYTGKDYNGNLYTMDGYRKANVHEEKGRYYEDNQTKNGDAWIGRPLILGNYYIKELARSEGYELSITGKDREVTNITDATKKGYGNEEGSKSHPKGRAWISKRLEHAVTFPESNAAYGNRENLFTVEVTSYQAEDGFYVVFDGIPEGADFYYDDTVTKPVTVQVVQGGEWVDAKEAPLYETARDSTILKRGQDGNAIEDPQAEKTLPCSYRGNAYHLKTLAASGTAAPTEPVTYGSFFTGDEKDRNYVKYEAEAMMRALGMRTPRDSSGAYSQTDAPVYDSGNGMDYRMPLVTLTVGDVTTNASLITAILDYLMEQRIYTYASVESIETDPELKNGGTESTERSGMESMERNRMEIAEGSGMEIAEGSGLKKFGNDQTDGKTVTVTLAVGMLPKKGFLYETDDDGTITAAYLLKPDKASGRYAIRRYDTTQMGTAVLSTPTLSSSVILSVAPDYEISADGSVKECFTYLSPNDAFLHYEAGDVLYTYWEKGADGTYYGVNPVTRKVWEPIYVEQELETSTLETTKVAFVKDKAMVTDPIGSTYVTYDGASGQYLLHVGNKDADLSGTKISCFTIALPDGSTTVTEEDLDRIGNGNVWGIQAGDELNDSLYLMRCKGVGAAAFTSQGSDETISYVKSQPLIYKGNHDKKEDGNTDVSPNVVLERVISQKIKVTKTIDGSTYADDTYGRIHADPITAAIGSYAGNAAAEKLDRFRFKVYLKSNLERLRRDEDGTVTWLDRSGAAIDILKEKKNYPALVPKIYTSPLQDLKDQQMGESGSGLVNDALYDRIDGVIADTPNSGHTRILELVEDTVEDGEGDKTGDGTGNGTENEACVKKRYNYKKFFDALAVAEGDKWREHDPTYTSYQPIGNAPNRTENAIENAGASDRVRQFAITWYLEDEVEKLTSKNGAEIQSDERIGNLQTSYADELYDHALAEAIKKAENYLKPFFSYDLDEIYAIAWDGEAHGGTDHDPTTLSADTLCGETAYGADGYYFGVSAYLPYGTYVVVEQQPQETVAGDLKNRHYRTDEPKEVILPSVYASYEDSQSDPEVWNPYYRYDAGMTAEQMQARYQIRLEKGLDPTYEKALVPWSIVAPTDQKAEKTETAVSANGESSYRGYAYSKFQNRFFALKLRLEKLDSKTHENILHDEAVFCIYAAEREDGEDGNGRVRFYEEDTTISGSRAFLESMCATDIRPMERKAGWFMRLFNKKNGVEKDEETLYTGVVPAGTPICLEEEPIVLTEKTEETGKMEETDGLMATDHSYSTMGTFWMEDTGGESSWQKQNVGYLETPKPLGAGAYVLCEIKAPAGYVRSKPIAIEIYSDKVSYYKKGDRDERVLAAIYEAGADPSDAKEDEQENGEVLARISVENEPIRLSVEKVKETEEAAQAFVYRVSGRVEGSLAEIGNDPELVYAYKNGDYLGYAWKKGTLEYLTERKKNGECVNLVYDGNVFSGYAYITRKRSAEEKENPYVVGAKMALFKALELTPSGDFEDHAYQDLVVKRSDTGVVIEMYVESEVGRSDILYYDLGNLDIIESEVIAGKVSSYGYDRNHEKVNLEQLNADQSVLRENDVQPSIFAWKGSRPFLELVGGDFQQISYSKKDKSLIVGAGTKVYHLDQDGVRDALVDPCTGMAYVEEMTEDGTKKILVWQVTLRKADDGTILARDKVLTSRLATIGERDDRGNVIGADAEEKGYISGSWSAEDQEQSHVEDSMRQTSCGQDLNGEILLKRHTGSFQKSMDPVYDRYGMVKYYPNCGRTYQDKIQLYDRNEEFVRSQQPDAAGMYHLASYCAEEVQKETDAGEGVQDEPNVGEGVLREPNDEPDAGECAEDTDWQISHHRLGEGYLTDNVWFSSEQTPNDPFDTAWTSGQADVLKRVPVGNYIMEELESPSGYLKGMPVGITICGVDDIQRTKMTDATTKVEISKIDGALHENEVGSYTHRLVSGAELALYPAKRVHTADFQNYPSGYYLATTSDAAVEAWETGAHPIYTEQLAAGDYLLVEEKTPEGFVTAEPLELEIKHISEVQVIPMYNDHTKVAIEKYTMKNGQRMSIRGARFTLYRALTDEAGNLCCEKGHPQYEADAVVDQWTTEKVEDLREFAHNFEAMYPEFGARIGNSVTWETETGGKKASCIAVDSIDSSLENGMETIYPTKAILLFQTEDGRQIRIHVYEEKQNASGKDFTYEYQFDYCALPQINEYANAYVTLDGVRRMEYLPSGSRYVLVETETPQGFRTAEPVVITVENDAKLQLYSVENQEILPLPEPPTPEPPEPPEPPTPEPPTPEPPTPEPPEPPTPEPPTPEPPAPESSAPELAEPNPSVSEPPKSEPLYQPQEEFPIEEKRMGWITAVYDPNEWKCFYFDENGKLHLRLPKTGESGIYLIDAVVFVSSSLGLFFLKKRKRPAD